MNRREFIILLGGAAAWPLAARAQRPEMPVIGLLQLGAPSSWDFTGFHQGLKDTGYVEDQTLARIEVRWANNDSDRLQELAADVPFWLPQRSQSDLGSRVARQRRTSCGC